ncbi:hypothetical protein AKJ39_04780 [candidate division MSBL1 archaeon SCGC-AAA259J03]|uniref:Uncharacterized protein n=1 Tax=candidate division MSBL1 archaeon SCGC-AAA259J03 TaxID=1698269 RepID=A0A656YXG0_9EURY|nr:hypothetical protein AKJ39_04780 [candidate division MSBL1 archaeon SCGC-AAA259J03]
MCVKKVERAKIDYEPEINRMRKLCYIELEKVISRVSLAASDPSENKIYLVKEIRKPTPQKLVRNLQRDELNLNMGPNYKSDLKKFLLGLLDELFENAIISKSDVDDLFILSDFYWFIEKPEDMSSFINKIMNLCEEVLGDSINKINFESPKVAGSELKAKIGLVGSNKIMASESQSNLPLDGYMDLSTHLSGLFISPNRKNNLGLLSGVGLEILDALARGKSGGAHDYDTAFQLPSSKGMAYEEITDDFVTPISNLISVGRIPAGNKRIGEIPINVGESYGQEIKLIGCDVGANGNNLREITELGQRAASYGLSTLKKLIDQTFVRLVGEIIKSLYEEELISSKSNICISSRRESSGNEFNSISNHLEEMGFGEIGKNIVYTENPASFGIQDLKRYGKGKWIESVYS